MSDKFKIDLIPNYGNPRIRMTIPHGEGEFHAEFDAGNTKAFDVAAGVLIEKAAGFSKADLSRAVFETYQRMEKEQA